MSKCSVQRVSLNRDKASLTCVIDIEDDVLNGGLSAREGVEIDEMGIGQ